MDKIFPDLYITDNDPTTLATKSPADWYKVEFNDQVPEESLGWMLAQGWTILGRNLTPQGTFTMQRRVINPEEVLKDLVADYTAAYNEGRELNDQRYDDIVTLYSAMVDKTEDEANVLEAQDSTYNVLIELVITSITADYNTYAADVNDGFDDYGDSIRSQINTRFDNQLASARNDLISRGMYNTTIWNSISAGIERERSLSLSDLEDKITQQQIGLKHRVYSERAGMWQQILAARDRLRGSLQASKERHVAARNAVLGAMLNFMERRTDSYPNLGEIGRLAANLGAGNPTAFQPGGN